MHEVVSEFWSVVGTSLRLLAIFTFFDEHCVLCIVNYMRLLLYHGQTGSYRRAYACQRFHQQVTVFKPCIEGDFSANFLSALSGNSTTGS